MIGSGPKRYPLLKFSPSSISELVLYPAYRVPSLDVRAARAPTLTSASTNGSHDAPLLEMHFASIMI